MHHKRKGPKSTRAGCLMCKPQKRQGWPLKERLRFGQIRKLAVMAEKIADETGAPPRPC